MRIAVVGNGCTGKTTLSRRLGAMLGLPVHHTDTLLWRPGWVQAPAEEFDAAHDAILADAGWVFDGLATWPSLERRVAAADVILFPDYPIEQIRDWARRRIDERGDRPRDELPAGCPESAIAERLIPLLERVHAEWRPKLVALLEETARVKPVHRFPSPEETERFIAAVGKDPRALEHRHTGWA